MTEKIIGYKITVPSGDTYGEQQHVTIPDDYINKRLLLNILDNMRQEKDFEMQRAAENEEYDVAWMCQVASREIGVMIRRIKDLMV